jgi:hypothetical protein
VQQVETEAGVTRLKQVVQTVPADRLREINMRLIAANPDFKRALARELIGVNASTGSLEPSYAVCKNCKKEYNASAKRVKGECVYHDGACC